MSTTLTIPDAHSPGKAHVFRLYRDGHVVYNQQIMGRMFYRSFQRANRKHGYYDYLKKICSNPTLFARLHAV